MMDHVPPPPSRAKSSRWPLSAALLAASVVVGAGVIWWVQSPNEVADAQEAEPIAADSVAAAPAAESVDATSGSAPKNGAPSGANGSGSGSGTRINPAIEAQSETGELRSDLTKATLTEQANTLDPTNDGWDSEALSERTNARYKQLAKWLESGLPSRDKFEAFAAPDFHCGPLRSAAATAVFGDGVLDVRRRPGTDAAAANDFRGPAGLSEALADLRTPFADAQHTHVKFKQFRIEPGEGMTQTTAYFHAFGETPDGPIEANSTWTNWWRHGEDGALTLQRIAVADEEVVSARIDSPTLFSDCTASVLGATALFREQLSIGVAEWRNRLPANLNLQYHGHMGLAIGDVNADGLEDLYICQPGGLPNALLIQQPDGTVVNEAEAWGVDFLNYTRGALLVDLDNDGDQDLILTIIDEVAVLENDGSGRFVIRAELPEIQGAYSIAAADFDEDRDLDFYVCRHRGGGFEKGEFPVPYPYYDANNGGSNFLLRNDGDWRFTDATVELGLDVDNRRFSFAASWEDYDNDGDLDLYVANDFGRNSLYRNDDGHFTSASDAAGLDDTAFGMSVTWGDYNRDGLMDMYVGNMFSAAGNRITFQDRFRPESSDEARGRYQRTARGNSLFLNAGDGTFRDVSEESAVTLGRWSWASLFADINDDGWEDLLVTNGFVTGDTIDDL